MKGGDFMELLFFLIIAAITIVGKIIQSQSKQNEQRNKRDGRGNANDDDKWENWQPEPGAGEEWQSLFDPQPHPTPNSNPSIPAPQTIKYGRTSADATVKKQSSPYQNSDWPNADSQTHKRTTPPNNDIQYAMDNNGDVDPTAMREMQKAMALAIPNAKKLNRNATGKTRTIKLVVNGRKDLRRAVLLNEVLGQPRAFDL